MKARGSALIIAMLLIAAVGGIAFGIGRILFIESTTAAYYTSGAVAYYAAESGIEEGFLRYRFNKNSEIPYANFSNSATDKNKVFRSNLTDQTTDTGTSDSGVSIIDQVSVDLGAQKQRYDLRMGFIGTNVGGTWGSFYGHDMNGDGVVDISNDLSNASYSTGDFAFLTLSKDQELKLDLTKMNLYTDSLYAGFRVDGLADLNNDTKCNAMVEVKLVVTDTSGTTREYKGLLTHNSATCGPIVGIDPNRLTNAELTSIAGSPSSFIIGTGSGYDLMDIITSSPSPAPQPATNSKNITLTIKPLYFEDSNAVTTSVFLQKSNCNSASCFERTTVVPGPFTYITSTGYYGGTSRKLEANIDRQSGTLYDLFDYVIFKSS